MRAIVSFLLAGVAMAANMASAQYGLGVDKHVTFRPYLSGSMSRISKETKVVITSQDQFQQYWKESTGRDGSEAPTDVDFGTEQLVAFHLGTRPTSGYKVFIKSVERVRPTEIKVTAQESKPSGARVAQHITSPYVIIRMPRISVNYSFGLAQVDAPGAIIGMPPAPSSCNCACGCAQTGVCNCGRDFRQDD